MHRAQGELPLGLLGSWPGRIVPVAAWLRSGTAWTQRARRLQLMALHLWQMASRQEDRHQGPEFFGERAGPALPGMPRLAGQLRRTHLKVGNADGKSGDSAV